MEIFRTNYVDYHNRVVCHGDYRNNKNPLLKFDDIEGITTDNMTLKHARQIELIE